MDKYGTEWAISSKEVREKSDKTKIERYGTTNMTQVPEIVKKENKQIWKDIERRRNLHE